ncbi:MAG: DNA polymerase III subunit delta [Granulosicoccus sp.]|nr:DNA polymerase III subunit delta [Granulosicoccus sp.]
MKLNPDRLDSHLQRGLSPVYLLYGDEPLQLMEIGDHLREEARRNGFVERQVIFANGDADWSTFREAAESLSLFSDQRLIDLRLPDGKPGRVGAEELRRYCARQPPDVLLLITSGKLEGTGNKSAWFKAIDEAGVTLHVLPIPPNKLGPWLAARLAAKGLQVDRETLTLMVERVEGNLLAARQEVDRLALLYPPGEISREQVLIAVSDSARYSIGDLPAAALAGDSVRALRILSGLHDEAVSELLILWSLVSEIRAGARTAEAIEAGQGENAALKSAGVWQSRAQPLKRALARHTAASWLSMLSACSQIDRQIKGRAPGSSRDALAALTTELAGHGEIPLKRHPGIPA